MSKTDKSRIGSVKVTGLENDYYLMFNPILVGIAVPSFIGSEGNENITGRANIKLTYNSLVFELNVTSINGRALIRIDEAIQSIITAPKLQQSGMAQEGVYRIKIDITATSGEGVFTETINKYFVYGGSDFSKVKHTTNNFVTQGQGLTSNKVPLFEGYPNYVYALVNDTLRPSFIRQGANSIKVRLTDRCEMITELQYRNRSGGVNLWVFNNYSIKPNGSNEKYTNPINDFEEQERGSLGYDIVLHSKADKRLRNYIENIIGSQEIRIKGLDIDTFDNNEVRPNAKEWLNLKFDSLNVTETHDKYMEIELKLSI